MLIIIRRLLKAQYIIHQHKCATQGTMPFILKPGQKYLQKPTKQKPHALQHGAFYILYVQLYSFCYHQPETVAVYVYDFEFFIIF